MFIDPNDFHNFMAQQVWKQTLHSIICYAITFRDRDKTDEEMDQSGYQEEVGRIVQACHDRVRGNRDINSLTTVGDRALIFEAIMKEALEIMGAEVP